MRRDRLRNLLFVVVFIALLGTVAATIGVFVSGDEGEATTPSPTATKIAGTPTPTPTCDTGSGEWALDESLHGRDGKILNDGLPAETAAAIDVIEAAARQDPFVLRQLLLDYGVSGVPTLEELRCVEARRDWWLRLDGILMAAEKTMVPLREVLGLPPTVQGDVTISNSMVVNGNVEIVNSQVNVGEQVLAVTPPGAPEPVYHRTYCANKVVPVPPPPPGKGALLIVKTDDHEWGVPDWPMTVSGPGGFWAQVTTNWEGQAYLGDLVPGDYTVTEADLSGWEPVPPYGLVSSGSVREGETATVRFKNRQKEVMPPTPPPTVVPTPSPSATPTATPPPTATPMPSPSPTPSPTPPATPTPTPPCTPTPSPTPTPTPPPRCLVTILGPHRLDNTDTEARMQASIQWDQLPNFSYEIRWYLDGAFIGGGEQIIFMASLNTNHTLTVKVFKGDQVVCQDSANFAEGSIPPGEDIPGTEPLPTATPIPAPSPGTDPDDGYQGP